MPEVRLYESILDSDAWSESAETRVVWITLLIMANDSGMVCASIAGLARRCGLPEWVCEEAVGRLPGVWPEERGWHIEDISRYRDSKRSRPKKARKVTCPPSEEVLEIFETWVRANGLTTRHKLTTTRRAHITARLKSASPERIKAAIVACSLDQWCQDNGMTDITHCLRNDENLYRYEAKSAAQERGPAPDPAELRATIQEVRDKLALWRSEQAMAESGHLSHDQQRERWGYVPRERILSKCKERDAAKKRLASMGKL